VGEIHWSAPVLQRCKKSPIGDKPTNAHSWARSIHASHPDVYGGVWRNRVHNLSWNAALEIFAKLANFGSTFLVDEQTMRIEKKQVKE